MPIEQFRTLYNGYAIGSERKIYVEQHSKQLDAAVLLTELRERDGYTQDQLARLSGKSASTIAQIESGNIEVTLDTLNEIISATGHTIEFRII